MKENVVPLGFFLPPRRSELLSEMDSLIGFLLSGLVFLTNSISERLACVGQKSKEDSSSKVESIDVRSDGRIIIENIEFHCVVGTWDVFSSKS